MFQYIRVQMIHPCQAKCVWCSTYRKNPQFRALEKSGHAEDFHNAYIDIIAKYRPKEVFISGGEPLLYPKIESFLKTIAQHTEVIHIFTSYQFNRRVMDRFSKMSLPVDKIILNHTPIYFEPERWEKLTRGFPFEIYIDNVRKAAKLPMRKRFKFIINHSQFHDEVARFQQLIEPNQTCEISLKVINDQGAGLGVETMRRTSERVQERIYDLDTILKEAGWGDRVRPKTSVDVMKDVIKSGQIEQCVYRKKPLELRLAYYKGSPDKKVLKYRYCPYFPPDFGHKLHLGRDDISKLGKNYHKGPFRDHCGKCRMLNYKQPAK